MKTISKAFILAAALFLGGCASTNGNQTEGDPFEGYNRAMFQFNDTVDRVALKPAATAYRDYLPSFVQTAVHNFFSNVGDVWIMVNNFLQGKPENGLNDFMRVAVNTTFGLGGILDIASEAGITKHNEDFGQTLGKWGVKSGPYVVLPFFGPSTLRDTAALPFDIYGDPWTYTTPVSARNTGVAIRAVDTRATLLKASNLMDDAALDRYAFMRDGYLQRRQSLVYDGAPPPAKYDDDFYQP